MSYADILYDPHHDYSAHRIDVEVFGWSKDFKKVGVLAHDVTRKADGEHLGDAFLLVFPVGSLEPIQTMHSMTITQAPNPESPLPIAHVSKQLWSLGWPFLRMYPVRPQKKRPRGFMKVMPLWVPLKGEDGRCTPAVGFALELGGQKRYQPHAVSRLSLPCEHLRSTDHKTYWAKRDLAATMIRFDTSPTHNEESVRIPLSASWKMARPLTIEIQGSASPEDLNKLRQFATVRKRPLPSESNREVAFQGDLQYLSVTLGHRFNAGVQADESLPKGVDIRITLGEIEPAQEHEGADERRQRIDTDYRSEEGESGYSPSPYRGEAGP